MNIETLTALGGVIVLIIGAVTTASIRIIKAIKVNNRITVAGQEAGAARGKVRDKRIQEIHVLTNSRFTAILKLILVMTKKEADRTKKAEDLEIYNAALEQVKISEEAANKVMLIREDDEDVIAARLAETRLERTQESI